MSLQFFREIDVVVALMMMSEGFGGGHYREKQHCLAFGLFCPYDCLNYHWTRKKEILEIRIQLLVRERGHHFLPDLFSFPVKYPDCCLQRVWVCTQVSS